MGYIGTGSRALATLLRLLSAHARPLTDTSSSHPTKVVLAWLAPVSHCPYTRQHWHGMPHENHPPAYAHSSSSHATRVTLTQNTLESPRSSPCELQPSAREILVWSTTGTPGPHPLQFQQSCQDGPGTAHLRTPQSCLHWIQLISQGNHSEWYWGSL